MTAHIVLPAPSSVPGHIRRKCTATGCPWQAHRPKDELRELLRLARAHNENPDGEQAAGAPA